MFIPLSCFYIPPATLCKTYFCTDQIVKILQGFVLSDQATDPPSLAASCGGSLYLTQQCPPPLSNTPNPERPFMGTCLHEIQSLDFLSFKLCSFLKKCELERVIYYLPVWLLV